MTTPDLYIVLKPVRDLPRGRYILAFINGEFACLVHEDGVFTVYRAVLPDDAKADDRLLLTEDGRFEFPAPATTADVDIVDLVLQTTVDVVASKLGLSEDAARRYIVQQLI